MVLQTASVNLCIPDGIVLAREYTHTFEQRPRLPELEAPEWKWTA
jgi:hypothetical protein